MNTRPTKRSSLFLLELIIAILFFSLAATVCVRLFIKSHILERDTLDTNHAVTSATSVAEIIQHQEDPFKYLSIYYSDSIQTTDSFFIYYDENWNPCTKQQAVYQLLLKTNIADSLFTGHIQVTKDSDSLYQLTIKKHIVSEADKL